MSFPFEIEDEVESSTDYREPCEFEINFETGELTGKKVYGIDAIKVWIWNALHTPRYRYIIYTWDYGHELDDIIGKGYSQDYLDTEIARMIEECLLMNPNITAVSDFRFIVDGDKLTGTFLLETVYGKEEINV